MREGEEGSNEWEGEREGGRGRGRYIVGRVREWEGGERERGERERESENLLAPTSATRLNTLDTHQCYMKLKVLL